MISLDAGFSAPNSPFYLNANLGFNNRTENLSDEIRYGVEAGVNVSKSILVLGRLQSVNSLRNGSTDPSAIQGLFSNNVEYMILSPEINWSFTKSLGISTSVSIPISGNQVLGNTAYNVGFFWNLSDNWSSKKRNIEVGSSFKSEPFSKQMEMCPPSIDLTNWWKLP